MDKKLKEVISKVMPLPPKGSLVVFNSGNSCFIKDDGCYVLKNWVNGEWIQSAHLFSEAIHHLKKLPLLSEK